MQINNDIMKNTISTKLKQYRIKADLTQSQLAEKANISVNFLQDIEYGRSNASMITLVNLSNALNITPNDFLKDFLSKDLVTDENIFQQIKLLSQHEKKAVYTLIQYFNNNCE